jgi:hypothetical protein
VLGGETSPLAALTLAVAVGLLPSACSQTGAPSDASSSPAPSAPSCDAIVASEQALVGADDCRPAAETCVDVHARGSWTREIYCGGGSYRLRPEAAKRFEALDTKLIDLKCPSPVWSSCPPKPASPRDH